MKTLKIQEIMSTPVFVAQPNDTLSRVRNLMLKHDVGRIVVVNEMQQPIGIVTHEDFVRYISQSSPIWRRRPIDQVFIKNIMNTQLIKISSKDEIYKAAEIMIEHGISGIPVTDNNRLAGIITKTDIVKIFPKLYRGKAKVREFMSCPAITVERQNTLSQVLDIMSENRISRVVVVENGKPIGILTNKDLAFVKSGEAETRVKEGALKVRQPFTILKTRSRPVRPSILVVEDIMTENPITIEADEDLSNAAETMIEKDIGGLPVTSQDELVGVITKRDILKSIVKLEGK
ncbi:MAG: CBS domain-containing protein [Candidatus Odinarchaeia archaeon]